MSISLPYLSCDDFADAVSSLALFYGVEEQRVRSLYELSWPDFLSEDLAFCELIDPRLAWGMGKILGADAMNYNLSACFYHRSRYDGDAQWFAAGLLNNQDGARAFLANLRRLVPDKSLLFDVESIVMSNIADRDQTVEHAGPYAFDCLSHAKSANRSGLDYSMPEFLMGQCWRGRESLLAKIKYCCIQHLVPVVVKFVGKPECMDLYVSHLWLYLHSQKIAVEYDDPCLFSFHGGGRNVPSKDIVELIRI